MTKKCSKCGREFTCSSEGPGCWCEQEEIAPDTLLRLRQEYDDCLCDMCLGGFSADRKESRELNP